MEERIRRLLEELKKYTVNHKRALDRCEMLESQTEKIEEAENSPGWREFGRRERWGGVDQVAWFRFFFTVPEEFAGKTAMISITTGREGEWYPGGPQYLVYVNQELRHGMDLYHETVRLCKDAVPGQKYEIYLQAFSGVKEILTEMQVDFYTEETAVASLYYDLKTVFDGIVLLDEKEKERHTVLLLLNSAVNLLDFRRPYSEEFRESVESARRFVQKEIYDKEWSSLGYTAYCVGHTHLDVAWLWTVEDTRRKAVRTFANAVDLMNRYPDYKFVCTQPAVYEFVEEDAPELYEQVRARIKEGRFEPEGSMWIEPDCNIPSGESFVRQLLLGKGYVKERFGEESRIVWLPDTFGFSASLPQILKKSGVDYFATTKLSWNETNRFPYDVFRWRGIDGTEILSYFTNQHAAYLGVKPLREVWENQIGKDVSSEVLVPFGWGDAGGGATEDMLEAGERMLKGVPGSPQVKMSRMGDFMDALEVETNGNKRVPVWCGELYLELHRGTLTSIAKAKQYNRKSEFLYHDAEIFSVMAGCLTGFAYPAEPLLEGWKLIALNQFHDVLPGSAIKEVYVKTFEEYETVARLGNGVTQAALEEISHRVGLDRRAVLVFNSLGFQAGDVVCLPQGIPEGMVTDGVNRWPVQRTANGNSVFFADGVPAKGYKAFYLEEAPAQEKKSAGVNSNGTLWVDNSFYRGELDQTGAILSLYDKAAEREVLRCGRGNVLQAFEDMPYYFNDAWDIAPYFEEKMWEVCENASARITEDGPVRTVIHVEKSFLTSTFSQEIIFYRDHSRIDFVTTADWKEKFVLLKVLFPVNVHAESAVYDIQFGSIRRPTHFNTSWDRARFEVCGHKWADLSQDDFGVSLLNDCKYGYDIKDGNMRLTLLKSSEYPNPEADRHVHTFTYSLYPHLGTVTAGQTIAQGYRLNDPLRPVLMEPQVGMLPDCWSMMAVDKENVIVETVKKAERRNTVIVRLYEACGRSGRAKLKTAIKLGNAWDCDLMENRLTGIPLEGGELDFSINPFEIKTIELEIEKI